MNAEELQTLQSPLKARYRQDPTAAQITLHAQGSIGSANVTCQLKGAKGMIDAGLHPATGGDGLAACSGDMLLEAIVACAGVTLGAVAAALDVSVRSGTVTAEGDLDFRGTLAVDKEVPVGFKEIRLHFDLDTNASGEQLETLLKLSERYCVIYQTLVHSPRLNVSHQTNTGT